MHSVLLHLIDRQRGAKWYLGVNERTHLPNLDRESETAYDQVNVHVLQTSSSPNGINNLFKNVILNGRPEGLHFWLESNFRAW